MAGRGARNRHRARGDAFNENDAPACGRNGAAAVCGCGDLGIEMVLSSCAAVE